MWRCPHCGTPQAETSRCWVCRRSSTACATCQNFRSSVAAQLGYCGLDRQRLPLRGDEIRACWEAAAPLPEVTDPTPRRAVTDDPDRTPVRRLEFVEVPTGPEPHRLRRRNASRSTGGRTAPAAADVQGPIEEPVAVGPSEPRWSLWGDTDT
jgi:hypothetical protein